MAQVTLPQPVLFVLVKLATAGFEGYVVGGAVRDLLTGKTVNDWDFTTDATPEQIQAQFTGSFYDNTYGTVMIPANALF